MKKLVLSACLVLVALLLWQFRGTEVDLPEALERSGVAQENEAPSESTELESRASAESRVPQRSTAEVAEAASEFVDVTWAATAPPKETVFVRGEVLLVDDAGVEHAGLTGRGACNLWNDNHVAYKNFDIQFGRFEFEASAAEQFELRSVVLEGATAVPEELKQRLDLNGELLVLRVVHPPTIELHVLDAQTGAHLDRVEMRGSTIYPAAGLSIPNDSFEAREVGDGRSPLRLVATAEENKRPSSRFLVRSPGHAWTPVMLDMRRSGQFELRLDLASQLEVDLVGESPHANSRVRLYRVESESELSAQGVNFESPITEAIVQLERHHEFIDLRPGTYDVRLQLGASSLNRVTLCELRVDLVAGARQRVALSVEPRPEFERGRLQGRVRIPAEWKIGDFGVYAGMNDTALDPEKKNNYLARNALIATEGTPDTFDFDFGELQVGEYTLGVRTHHRVRPKLDYSTTIQLTAPGPSDLLLDVPPPALVSIRVEYEGESDKTNRWFTWSQVTRLDPGMRGPVGRATHDIKEGADGFEFQAPVGDIQVFLMEPGYQPILKQLTVLPGHNRFVLNAELAANVQFQLRDGETIVSWRRGGFPTVEPLTGSGRLISFRPMGDGQRASLTEPGRYRMMEVEIEGFEPIEYVEFEAFRGEVVVHVIQLTRK